MIIFGSISKCHNIGVFLNGQDEPNRNAFRANSITYLRRGFQTFARHLSCLPTWINQTL